MIYTKVYYDEEYTSKWIFESIVVYDVYAEELRNYIYKCMTFKGRVYIEFYII